MLDKYESFYKLSKSPECSIYTAFNRVTAQNVLMKRIKTELAWNAILSHRHIQLMTKVKIFPRMAEILRHKGHFYIVFEKPYGNSLAMENAIERVAPASFYQLFSDLLEGIKEIQVSVPNVSVLPQWIYFHRNSLKIVHFQTFLDAEPAETKHVFTYGMGSENPQLPDQTEDETDFLPDEYRKAMVFHLGVLAYRFLVGKKEEKITSKEDYELIFANIRENCERQILKVTGDSRLASFIMKMMSTNQFEVPNFTQVSNFFQGRVLEQKSKETHKNLSMDIELQKIHISTGRAIKQPKIKMRKCCIRQTQIGNLIKNEKMAKLNAKSQLNINTAKKSKLLLPYIAMNRNLSCLNRHNPLLSATNKQRINREHIKSYDFYRSEEQD